MLWLYKHKSSSSFSSFPLLKILSFASLHQLSSQTRQPHNFSPQRTNLYNKMCKKTAPKLTSQAVLTTLSNFSSDLLALSFFMWCAKQRNYFHDRDAFDFMVSVVRRLTESCKSVEVIVRKLESVGCDVKAQCFLLLMRLYWRGGMYDMVLETFDQMGCFGFTPNTFAHNVLMDVLFRIGRVGVGLMMLREMPEPNFLSFNIALCNLCKLGDLVNAGGVFRMMLRRGFFPNVETMEVVLNCFCRNGRLREGLQVLDLMIAMGIPLSVNVWSILVHGYCKCGMVSAADNLLKRMIKVGCSPNIVTYTTLFKGYIKADMVDNSFEVLKKIDVGRISHDIVFCNVLIDCLTKIRRYDDALDVFGKLRQQNLFPDCYTFSSLLATICSSRKFDQLPKLASGFAVEVDLVVCNAMLKYFCKAGYPSLAVTFFYDIVDRGFAPDKYSFIGLLTGLCGSGRIDEAIIIYNGLIINNPVLDPHFHTIVIGGLIKSGKYHEAVRIFRRAVVQRCQLDVALYTVAIYGLLKGGRAAEACTLYNQMKETGIIPNEHTLNVMVHGLCKEQDIIMVKQLLEEMAKSRLGLKYSNVLRICKLVYRSQHLQPINDLLIEMTNLGLVPTTYHNELSSDGFVQDLNSDEDLKVYLRDHMDLFGYEDLSDLEVSIG